jgi:hypothetical protein
MQFKRPAALALAALATALTIFGVVYAATDSNVAGVAKDPFALHGSPPKTADLLVTVSTGQSYTLSANVNVNFAKSSVDAVVHFPLVFSVTSVDLRLVGKHVYAEATDISSGTWLAFTVHPPAFFGLSLEVTKPDISFIKGLKETSVTKNGYQTTHSYSRNNVAMRNILGSAKNDVVLGSLKLSVTEGSSQEFTGGMMIMKSAHAMTKVTVQVLSYNQPAVITAPSAKDVKTIVGSTLPQLFASSSITSILIPENFASLILGSQQVS